MAMKLAFSTLACPEWSWKDIYPMAHDLGYAGIEIRGLGEEITASHAKPFLPSEVDRTMENLRKLGLEIPCFSSNCVLAYEDGAKIAPTEIGEYVALANKCGASYVRILADAHPAPEGEVDDEKIVAALKDLAPLCEGKNVTLLVETNGVYADTARLRKLIDAVDSPYVKVLWDVHHPFRYFGESVETTWANVGDLVRYIHVKDSIKEEDGTVAYRLPGHGDLPLEELFELLDKNGYDGFVSLEWVKRWAKEIESAAIVFPQFINFVRTWEKTKGTKKVIEPSKKESKTEVRPEAPIEVVPSNIKYVEKGKGQRMFEKDVLVEMTFGQMLDKVATEFPDQTAFAYTMRDYTRTYSEFRDDVDRVSKMLMAMGVKKDSHVALWATNRPQWFLTFWACVRIGAVLVTVNTAYKIHEIEYLLRQSDSDTLVMMDGYKDINYVDIVNEICPELAKSKPGEMVSERLPYLKNVITIDNRYDGCFFWDDEFETADSKVSDADLRAMIDATKPDEVCNMQYTSGTTGFPKGVMLTHRNVLNNGKCIGDCMNLSTEDRLLIQVPMFHCFGMVLAMTASVTHGVTMVPLDYFSPRKVLASITARRVTAMHGVPTMFIALLENPDFEKTDFSYMRTGIMAGSPCPIPVMEDVVNKMNMKEITIVYGQTEAAPGCTQSRVDDSIEVRVQTVGKELPGVECRIVDPATNEVLPDNVDGEFCARGYNIMKGYYKMPEATKAAIDEDGWLHTGDLARRTPEGYYKITGRIKDMIIRGGENIYPKEIEEFIYTHPDVSDVQVIGVPDEQYGEEIMACIIKKEGSTLTEEDVKKYVKDHMAKHKTPRYVAFVDSFPMNAAGKILKFKMREDAVKMLGLEKASKIETA